MNPSKGLVIPDELNGQRLDKALADIFTDISRSRWAKRINNKQVLIDGNEVKPDYKVSMGDPVTIAEVTVSPMIGTISVLYEDEHILVINKPAGVLVHNKGGESEEVTVAEYFKEKLPPDGSNRPGVVHRLDRGTSGVMCLAKDSKTLAHLQKQFAGHLVKKIYYAMVAGVPKDNKAKLLWPIERNPRKPATFRVAATGRPAETDYAVVKTYGRRSLLKLTPKTGRTHQLRVHLKKLGFPIIGDTLYGGPKAERLMLHAASLTIKLPGGQTKTFDAPMPSDFQL